MEGIQVNTVFTMEPEAGRWPEICLPGTGSVGEPAFVGLNHLTPLKTKQHLIPTSLSSDTFDPRWLDLWQTNSSALQAMISCSAHGRMVINNAQSVINDMMKTTWVKGCQLLTIQIQWQPEWRIISYQQYDKDNLNERLSFSINVW